jgi:hypothetical protein
VDCYVRAQPCAEFCKVMLCLVTKAGMARSTDYTGTSLNEAKRRGRPTLHNRREKATGDTPGRICASPICGIVPARADYNLALQSQTRLLRGLRALPGQRFSVLVEHRILESGRQLPAAEGAVAALREVTRALAGPAAQLQRRRWLRHTTSPSHRAPERPRRKERNMRSARSCQRGPVR